MMKEQCAIGECNQPAKYSLYKTSWHDGSKAWLNVCSYHEYQIGNENMQRAGGRVTEETLADLRAMRTAGRIKG